MPRTSKRKSTSVANPTVSAKTTRSTNTDVDNNGLQDTQTIPDRELEIPESEVVSSQEAINLAMIQSLTALTKAVGDIQKNSKQPSFDMKSSIEALGGEHSNQIGQFMPQQHLPNSFRPPAVTNASTNGYAMSSLSRIEMAPPVLKDAVTSGKDINLAYFLIPYSELPDLKTADIGYSAFSSSKKWKNTVDPRVCRPLSLPEYIKAFASYKTIMCEVFPQRMHELNLYERDVIEMALTFPGTGFYDYHRAFSAKAAAFCAKNVKIDWSVRDESLFTTIFAGSKATQCEHCKSPLHASDFCYMRARSTPSGSKLTYSVDNYPGPSNQNPNQPSFDNMGRLKSYHYGAEICNNFNSIKGCNKPVCSFAHVCKKCKDRHAIGNCPLVYRNPSSQWPGNQTQTQNLPFFNRNK